MIEQNTFTIIFGVFLLFTCRDMFFGNAGGDGQPGSGKAAVDHLHHHHPASITPSAAHMASISGIPTVKIQYCHSCGYRQAFDEISKMLQATFHDMKIEGELHQPNWLRMQIVNLSFYLKLAIIVMMYMEINPFTYLQMNTPAIWTVMTQSKISSSLIVLFISSAIETNMMSTGAFEIFYNDIPIWSKIETGRMPAGNELLQIITNQINFAVKSKVGDFVPT